MKLRSPRVCIALLLALLRLPAGAQNAQTAADRVAAALKNDDYQAALELLHPALQASPKDPQLWTMQGVAYLGERHREKALASFHRALAVSPDYLPALHQQAQLEYEAGSMAAIPVLRHILRLQPGDPTAHAMIAVVEYKNGHCAAAIPHFAKSGNLLDSQIDGLHAYATCLVREKQFDSAAKVLERALALHDDPRERRVLAAVQLMEPDPQAAITTLSPLVDSGSADASTLALAASAYEDAHDTDRAVKALRQAILLAPKDVSLYLEFAQISLQHSSYQVGVDVLNDGVAVQPDASQLYFARGVLYVNLAQFDKAEADFQKAYELDPNQSLTAAAQGLLAVQQNDLDRALTETRAKLAKKPGDPVLLYLQADILAQKGVAPGNADFVTALRSAQRAVALRPNLAPAHAVLAKLYLDAGKNQQAADECRKAIAIDPKDQTSLYRLIQALRKTGDTKETPELLKRLAQLRKDATQEERQRNRYKLVEGQ
ncbi:MAG TPA: tetratricopeptide repeat protein [Terriglobales bacterium]